MATWKELHAAALAAPDDDAPRLALAQYYRGQHPEQTEFMELQVQLGARRRTGLDTDHKLEDRCARLLKKHGGDWARTIAKFTKRYEFDRGMVEMIWIDPYVFLEHGAWLFVNAPIRHVYFEKSPGEPFPLAELLASELLMRLDTVHLVDKGLNDADVQAIAASPNVQRLLRLNLTDNPLRLAAFEAIAASSHLRGLLVVDRATHVFNDYSPIAEYAITDRDDRHGQPIWDFRPLPPDGVALEKKHGYLPWLHPRENSRSDLRYRVQRGELPVKPRGSPV